MAAASTVRMTGASRHAPRTREARSTLPHSMHALVPKAYFCFSSLVRHSVHNFVLVGRGLSKSRVSGGLKRDVLVYLCHRQFCIERAEPKSVAAVRVRALQPTPICLLRPVCDIRALLRDEHIS